VGGKLFREVAAHSRIPDERIDIRSHEVGEGMTGLLSVRVGR
jgi:hypothetical protein